MKIARFEHAGRIALGRVDEASATVTPLAAARGDPDPMIAHIERALAD